MLAQRFVAICDHKGCKAKTKCTVVFWLGQVVSGIGHPIMLQAKDIRFSESGWVFAWNSTVKRTEIFCPDHPRE